MSIGESSASSRRSARLPTVIAEQVMDNSRGYARGPERELMSALLFDGVQAYMSAKNSHEDRYKEAVSWVHAKCKEYIFSFENVCEGLGVDPEYLRFGLLNAAKSSEWVRGRRTS